MTYPREIFKDGGYRVVFGPEEHAALKKEAWSDERQAVEPLEANKPELMRTDANQPEPKRRGRPPKVREVEPIEVAP